MSVFADNVVRNLKDYLPDDVIKRADIRIVNTVKNNDRVLEALSIREPENMAAPMIYLDGYREAYYAGEKTMSEIMSDITATYLSAPKYSGNLDLRDYGTVKQYLEVRLADPDINSGFLSMRPHHPAAGFEEYYAVNIPGGAHGDKYSVTVTNELLESWGITPERVREDALAAENAKDDVLFARLEDFLLLTMTGKAEPENLWHKDPDEVNGLMFCLTRRAPGKAEDPFGAGVIAKDGVLERIAEITGGNYYVLPSSVHELIIVGDDGTMNARDLADIVKTINADEVKDEDLLSGKVHYYDRKTKELKVEKIPDEPSLRTAPRRPRL